MAKTTYIEEAHGLEAHSQVGLIASPHGYANPDNRSVRRLGLRR